MKQNRKGFTLIELLAVIVILAIIALIATPIILNMINEARRSAAKSSTLGFIDSIEYYAGFSEASQSGTGIKLQGYDKPVPASGVTCTRSTTNNVTTWTGDNSDTKCGDFMTGVEGKSKGKAPADGSTVKFGADGKVAQASLQYNNKTCSYTGASNDVTCS